MRLVRLEGASMSWPRLWRLWREPAAGSQWMDAAGHVVHVHFVTGPGQARRVAYCERETLRWGGYVECSLWAFRCWWVWLGEVH